MVLCYFHVLSLMASIARPYNSGLLLQIPTSSQATIISSAFINHQSLSDWWFFSQQHYSKQLSLWLAVCILMIPLVLPVRDESESFLHMEALRIREAKSLKVKQATRQQWLIVYQGVTEAHALHAAPLSTTAEVLGSTASPNFRRCTALAPEPEHCRCKATIMLNWEEIVRFGIWVTTSGSTASGYLKFHVLMW